MAGVLVIVERPALRCAVNNGGEPCLAALQARNSAGLVASLSYLMQAGAEREVVYPGDGRSTSAQSIIA